MYKLLIAEDEFYARERLKSCLDWEKYGFTIIAEAEDGEEAMEILTAQKIDLLIADIEMPIINGIQLAKILYEKKSMVKTIFLTGYDDFSFAQNAIHYGVKEYLLKPVDEAALLIALRDMKKLLDSEHELSRQTALGEMCYNKMKDELQEKMYVGRPEEVSRQLTEIFRYAKEKYTTAEEFNYLSQSLLDTLNEFCSRESRPKRKGKAIPHVNHYQEFLIKLFLEKVCNEGEVRNSGSASIVELAKKYILLHYREENLSLTLISKSCFVNPTYLSRIFNQNTGKSLPTYIKELRLEHAVEMIEDGVTSIDSLAVTNGFQNIGYFSTCFKEKYGLRPSEYIKNKSDNGITR